ncbi:XRE family transcriptional regulator [Eggerthella sinensis]|uniref:XRE family transcriptional regulator n=2 Tax=Eggerthella sinensis TaxID=242230 RepID=A0A3N0IVB1_9ACTN|nr:XRE family transcriptional regulator [Eggerthella sinensis]RNM40913.1 XRE family transcriptional regulator [Eggerthella sinensis]
MPQTSKKGSFMNVEIAQRLATMRREQGYSQEELAEQLGLSRQAVSKWERAESSPDTGNLIALAKLYGVSIDDLLRIDDEVVDDILFEEKDKDVTAEAQAQEAAVRANEAAVRAAQAAVAAAQARATAEQAQQQIPQPQPQAQAQPQPQQPTQPYYGAPVAPQAPVPPQAPYAPDPYDRHPDRRNRGPWSTFPYPVFCVFAYMVLGFLFGAWHPGWILFLSIPLYYWIAHIIENDPNYRADRR